MADDDILQLLKTRRTPACACGFSARSKKKWSDAGFKLEVPGRLHVRVSKDGRCAFVGSQSLRKPELDERREVGIVIRDARLVKRLANVFERTDARKRAARRRRSSSAALEGCHSAARDCCRERAERGEHLRVAVAPLRPLGFGSTNTRAPPRRSSCHPSAIEALRRSGKSASVERDAD